MEIQRIKDLLSDAEDKLAQAEDLLEEGMTDIEDQTGEPWDSFEYTLVSVQGARTEVDDARGDSGLANSSVKEAYGA